MFGAPLGAPQAALMLERLIAMGARRILILGCCGSLQPALKVGHLVVPTAALSEEGTSAHYPSRGGRAARADREIARLCRAGCGERSLPASAGRVWTTDALFRETRGKVARYGAQGLLAVEMEV